MVLSGVCARLVVLALTVWPSFIGCLYCAVINTMAWYVFLELCTRIERRRLGGCAERQTTSQVYAFHEQSVCELDGKKRLCIIIEATHPLDNNNKSMVTWVIAETIE